MSRARSNIVLAASIAVFSLGLLVPILFLFIASFVSDEALNSGLPSLSYALDNTMSKAQMAERIEYISSDGLLISALARSLFTSILCATFVSLSAWVAGYYFTRSDNWFVRLSLPLAISSYFVPPVILVIAISNFGSIGILDGPSVRIFLGHSMFLFPIAYILSIGFWLQKPIQLDQMASTDGANFWSRIWLHMGNQDFARVLTVGLLVFMVSWGDIIFSRVLGSSDNSDRLLVDLIYQKLYSNSVVEAYGAIAAFSSVVVIVSSAFSVLLAMALSREAEKESH